MEVLINEFMANKKTPSDVYLITKEFSTPTEFSQYIERHAYISGSSCWDVLIDYCIKKEIEAESISKLINTSLKTKIEAEVRDLNLIKGKKESKLPF